MKDFLTKEQELEVVQAIQKAESQTSGEIRVVITSRWVLRPECHTRRLFEKLGMDRTHHRNGALIVLFSRHRRFVLQGDSGFQQRVGPDYWQGMAAKMTALLQDGRKVDSLTDTVRALGETMAKHWPPEKTNPDELPNALLID